MPVTLTLDPGHLTLDDLRRIYRQPMVLELAESCQTKVRAAQATVDQVLADGQVVYGINTGFGLLANTRIAEQDLELLQRSLVLSHAAGVGRWLPESVVRLILAMKINALAQGYSGVRYRLIEALLTLFNEQIYPCIPAKGSVGASGDLAPLAHMVLPLLGEGHVSYQGEIITGQQALDRMGRSPLQLAPKEGLALLNGTQVSTALALDGLLGAEDNLINAVVCGALSVEAAMGSRRPFDARLHQVRGHQSQQDISALYRLLLTESSAIGDAHQSCQRVQDPYSLRCQPQVMGACLQQWRFACQVLCTEANAVSDNPLVFSDQQEIISGGNFHAEPVAFAADNLALAIAEIGALSERRVALLIDTHISGLPPFLIENGGVNSGFMLAQVTAASLASENKSLAHPASVDSMPTSANQEDHVSMATFAGRRLNRMNHNTRSILAIEWLAACQGIDFRRPLRSSAPLEKAHQALRSVVSHYDKDRYFAADIEKALQQIQQRPLHHLLPPHCISGLTPNNDSAG